MITVDDRVLVRQEPVDCRFALHRLADSGVHRFAVCVEQVLVIEVRRFDHFGVEPHLRDASLYDPNENTRVLRLRDAYFTNATEGGESNQERLS